MIENKKYTGEKWKEMHLHKSLRKRYAISNYGRLVSFIDTIKKGDILKGSAINGYPIFIYKISQKDGTVEGKQLLLHRGVAAYFLKPPKKNEQFVIHLDFNKKNNYYRNLKWATKEGVEKHNKENPFVKKNTKKLVKYNKENPTSKLTEKQVIQIKKKLAVKNKPVTLKALAEKYGVSEMQISRIKRGENWGQIKI